MVTLVMGIRHLCCWAIRCGLGETDESLEWVHAVGKTQVKEETQKAKRLSLLAEKGLVKVTW